MTLAEFKTNYRTMAGTNAAAAAAAAAAFTATMYKTRKVIFLKQEKVLLADLVNSQLPSDINSKAKQPLVLRRKAKAWELITSAYNATLPASGPRTVKQLQKLWENLTGVAKRNEAKRREISSSDGGEHQQQQHLDDEHQLTSQYGDDAFNRGPAGGSAALSTNMCENEEDVVDHDVVADDRATNMNAALTDMIAKHAKRRPTIANGKFGHAAKTMRMSSSRSGNSTSYGAAGTVAADACTQEILAMRRREHVAKMEKLELEKQKLHIERDYWARRYEQDFGCNNYAHHASSSSGAAPSSSPHVWVPPGSIETVLTSGNAVQLTGLSQQSASNSST